MPPGAAGQGASEKGPSQVAKVLAVEDDHVIRGLLVVNLEMEGHEVLTAVDGRDALEVVAADLPDVIVLDVMLPNVDGWQVAERLKSEPETSKIPIILLSARAMEADIQRGYDLGVEHYVTKPFDPIDLMQLVQALADA